MAFLTNVNKIVIAGVGLIGGSVGLALKKAGFQGKIIGLGRRWSSLKQAIDVGAIDSAEMDFAVALKDADILLVSTPVDSILQIVREAIKYIPKGCVISDVGSTKSKLVDEIESLIPDGVYFVGGHPMAGSHKIGVDSANAGLFNKSLCILTPTKSTSDDTLNLISELWQGIGASVEIMSPEEHDFLISAASHLPHTVACALTRVVFNAKNNRGSAIDFAATGFADVTRIASGSPEIWKGILLQNAEKVISMIEMMESELDEFKAMLEARNGDLLIERLNQAKHIRDSFRK